MTETSPFLVAKTSIKYEKLAITALNNIKYNCKVDNGTKVLLIGINNTPPMVVAKKAYIEIVKDDISPLIFLVIRSLNPKKNMPINASIEELWKLFIPGLSIKITPQKPTITADQRRHPTFSLKKIAEPAVTSKGIACKKEETVDKEIKDIAYTIKIAPNISDIVRKNIKGFWMSLDLIIGIFCILPIIINRQTETIPTDIRIWETGISFDKIFIIRSSNAKLAIATVIKKIPRRFSNFSPYFS